MGFGQKRNTDWKLSFFLRVVLVPPHQSPSVENPSKTCAGRNKGVLPPVTLFDLLLAARQSTVPFDHESSM